MTHLIRISFACLSCALSVLAQEQGQPNLGPNVLLDLQVIALPQNQGVSLVRQMRDKSTALAAYGALQDLLSNGTAKLIGWPMVTTSSGQRAVVEGITEVRYPTEFQPGGVGFYAADEKGYINSERVEVNAVDFHPTPSAFEMRNTGVTFEVEPTVSRDGKTIALNLTPQHVRLNAMKEIAIRNEKTKERVVVEQPTFDVLKTTTTLTMKDGECKLLGVFKAPEPEGWLELFLLRVEIQKVD